MEICLTNEAKHALATVYKTYKNRRNAGIGKHQAVYFDGSSSDGKRVCAEVSECKQELCKAGFLCCDILGGVSLEDKAIVYMENKTIDTIKEWLSLGAQLF